MRQNVSLTYDVRAHTPRKRKYESLRILNKPRNPDPKLKTGPCARGPERVAPPLRTQLCELPASRPGKPRDQESTLRSAAGPSSSPGRPSLLQLPLQAGHQVCMLGVIWESTM